MNRPAYGLTVILFCWSCTSDVRACMPHPRLIPSAEALVRDAKAYGLGQVQSISQAGSEVIYRIKIDMPLGGQAIATNNARNSPYEFEIKVSSRDKGKVHRSSDFSRHTSLEFWSGATSAQPYDISCFVRLNLAKGQTYLAFDSPSLTTRSFEVVNSNDDLWLKAVLHEADPHVYPKPKLGLRSVLGHFDIAAVYDCPVTALPVQAGARTRDALNWTLEYSMGKLIGPKAPCSAGVKYVVLSPFPKVNDLRATFRIRDGSIDDQILERQLGLGIDPEGIASTQGILEQFPLVSSREK